MLSRKAEAMPSNQATIKSSATQSDLTYAEAFEVARIIQNYVASVGPQVSLETIRQTPRSAESKNAFKYKVGVFVTKAARATGEIILIALVIFGRGSVHHEGRLPLTTGLTRH
jgi:hypothetical protein